MMNNLGWHYYNYAFLPNCEPNEEVDTSLIRSGEIWKNREEKAFLARWTSNFDCGYETEWWYVIKDKPFDINAIKAKRRYEINKGKKNFYVKRINPLEFLEELYQVQIAAYSAYPSKYRPNIDKISWQKNIQDNWGKTNIYVFAAFFRETDEFCGYAMLSKKTQCINFEILKTVPFFEKYSINSAIVMHILSFFEEDLKNKHYICDGERNIQHETSFQDYLEKYFEFRKAYCNLNIAYKPGLNTIVKFMYLFKGIFAKFDGVRLIHKLNGVLVMEGLSRRQERR